MHFGQHKITLHEHGHDFTSHAKTPTPGSADFCLITNTPLNQVAAELRNLNIPIEEGPVVRSDGAGMMQSLYIRDPEQNLVKLSHYVQS